MIIRVLFLGVGAALRDGLAEPQVSLVVLHPFASKEMSEGRGGGPDRGVLSENPVNSSLRSAERQRYKWPLPTTQLPWARQCRAQWLGEGWAGSCCGEAARSQGKALDWESRHPGSWPRRFTGWRALGKSLHLSAQGSSIVWTPSQDCWKDQMVAWIGKCFKNICYNRFLLFWFLVLASIGHSPLDLF